MHTQKPSHTSTRTQIRLHKNTRTNMHIQTHTHTRGHMCAYMHTSMVYEQMHDEKNPFIRQRSNWRTNKARQRAVTDAEWLCKKRGDARNCAPDNITNLQALQGHGLAGGRAAGAAPVLRGRQDLIRWLG